MRESLEKRSARALIHWGLALTRVLGIAGVADFERQTARRWGTRLEMPLLLITFWIPFQWYLVHTGDMDPTDGFWIDQLIWGFFLVEQVVLLSTVRDRAFYLKTNWLMVAVVLLGLPLILFEAVAFLLGLRLLRGLLVVITALRLGRRYFRELGRHVFFAISLMTAFLIVLGGALMPMVEPETFPEFSDGVWWTLVTLATVGYGDYVPVSDTGRMIGLGFVAIAVIWMSLISASIAAFLVGLRMEANAEEDEQVDRHMIERLERIESLLEDMRHDRPSEGQRGDEK
ncbi:ion channel [Guyparkeria hydrothermalis]|uniref:ion channel n=1 Tax=Guyparkeria hydrothermalis TaxID=923 RepID=UPI0020212FE4|nr:ion channel [Guyparkeria hydrothermalis]